MSAGVLAFVTRLRPADGPDAELIAAYAAGRDADAFAALVRRHGPRVWAVCRRLAGPAAEDAFQATFLVLARKAGRLGGCPSVGGWLHTTAVHVSLRAKRSADRRREVPAGEVLAPPPPDRPDDEALAALDAAIQRLPAKLRDAVTLCELDGLSRTEAAGRLGVPEGTLSSRLAAARKRLADQLKGLRPGLLAVPAAVPAGLIATTSGLGAGAVPAPAVLTLAGGTMRAILLKGLVGAVLVGGLLAVGGRAEPPKAADPPKAGVAVNEGVILLSSWVPGQAPVLIQPDGTQLPAPALGAAADAWLIRLSPDGRQVAAVTTDSILARVMQAASDDAITAAREFRRANPWDRGRLFISPANPVTGPTEPVLEEGSTISGAWGPDGRLFYGSSIAKERQAGPATDGERRPWASWTLDPFTSTRAKTSLAVPVGLRIVDVSADGRQLLTRAGVIQSGGVVADRDDGTYLVPADTFTPVPVGGAGFVGDRLSPDGTRVLGWFVTPGTKEKPPTHTPAVVRVSDGAVIRLPLPAADADGGLGCWSPDGKRVALVWSEGVKPTATPFDTRPRVASVGEKPARAYATRVSVLDADGGNHRVVVRRAPGLPVSNIDWR